MNKNLVVIPTYNEKENIALIIDAVLSLPVLFDILVVDDNSPDGTADIVKEKILENDDRVFLECRLKKSGLGTAYVHGFKWALNKAYDSVFEMDADFSHNPLDLVKLHDSLRKGADVAIGSRYSTGVNVVNWPLQRVLLSYFASWYVRVITGMKIHDATAGFVAYRSSVLRTLDLDKVKFIGYAFQIEMKYRAYVAKFKIEEVPIIFTDRVRGQSKMSGSIIKEAVLGVIKLRIQKSLKTL